MDSTMANNNRTASNTTSDAVLKPEDIVAGSATNVDTAASDSAPAVQPVASTNIKRAAEEPLAEDEPPKKKPTVPSTMAKEMDPMTVPAESVGPSQGKGTTISQQPKETKPKDSIDVASKNPEKESEVSKSVPAATSKSSESAKENAPAAATNKSGKEGSKASGALDTSNGTRGGPKPDPETKPSEKTSRLPDRTTRSAAGTATTSTGKSDKAPQGASTKGKDAASSNTGTNTKPGRPSVSSKKASSSDLTNKPLKGLRHFSMMVCKKVEEKGQTTYNEVADELVKQVIESRKKEDAQGKLDEKNIRRRVYDSINVLLAMDIISKDKKDISWKGLPTMAQHDIEVLEREEQARKEQVQAKRRALQELLVQQICFRNLVTHNKRREMETLHADKVPLPFVIVNTNKDAIIHCNMAPDLRSVMLEFDRPFEINDDNSILTRLGMHRTTVPDLKKLVPEDLVTYCQEHGLLDDVLGEFEDDAEAPLALTSVGSNRGQYFQSLD